MRRTGRLFKLICERNNWKHAWIKAIRGKSEKPEVQAFRLDLDQNLERLRSSFEREIFPFGHYEYFTIYDPKERVICAASFAERIAHHAMMNVLEPYFERYQISDSYACRRGKGTEAAVLRGFRLVKESKYFLKMDVRKYFDSIDHEILNAALRLRFKDMHILRCFDSIIDSYETAPGKGIPIGNLTSQYFANHYLAALDHEAKEKSHCRRWIRYMDDILAGGMYRHDLSAFYMSIAEYCRRALALELKPAIIDECRRGAPFLGFLVKPTGIFLSRKTRKRFAAKYQSLEHGYKNHEIDESTFAQRTTAMCAHIDLAHARSFRYALFHGPVLGRQPRESRGQLEQRCVEREFGQSEQQQPRQQEQ